MTKNHKTTGTMYLVTHENSLDKGNMLRIPADPRDSCRQYMVCCPRCGHVTSVPDSPNMSIAEDVEPFRMTLSSAMRCGFCRVLISIIESTYTLTDDDLSMTTVIDIIEYMRRLRANVYALRHVPSVMDILSRDMRDLTNAVAGLKFLVERHLSNDGDADGDGDVPY